MFNLKKHILRTEGIRGLFKGNFTSCVKLFPTSMIQFATYFGLKISFAGEKGEMTTAQTALASATAGYTSTVITYPLDTIKTRLIAQPFDKGRILYSGIIDCTKKMVYLEGIGSLWKGVSAALLSTIPSTMSLFLTYEWLNSRFSPDFLSLANDCVMDGKRVSHGFTAAFVSLVFTHPLDTCRKKMQAFNARDLNRGGVDFEVRSLSQCFAHIWRKQWWLGLYAGFAPAALRVIPFNALMLYSYNKCKRYCLQYNGVPAEEKQRLLTRREEDMLREDLLNDDPPAVQLAKLYIKEQYELKHKGQKQDLHKNFKQFFKSKDE